MTIHEPLKTNFSITMFCSSTSRCDNIQGNERERKPERRTTNEFREELARHAIELNVSESCTTECQRKNGKLENLRKRRNRMHSNTKGACRPRMWARLGRWSGRRTSKNGQKKPNTQRLWTRHATRRAAPKENNPLHVLLLQKTPRKIAVSENCRMKNEENCIDRIDKLLLQMLPSLSSAAAQEQGTCLPLNQHKPQEECTQKTQPPPETLNYCE